MKTENEGLENKIRRESNIAYLALATLFAAGSAAAAVGAQYEPNHNVMLYGISAYSAILCAGTLFWRHKDLSSSERPCCRKS